MSGANDPLRDRAEELLATRALDALDPVEAAELERLLEALPDLDATAFDRLAAELELETLEVEALPALPPSLDARVAADAEAFFTLAPAPPERIAQPARRTPRPLGAEGPHEGPRAPERETPREPAQPLDARRRGPSAIPWALAAAAAAIAAYLGATRPREARVEAPVAEPRDVTPRAPREPAEPQPPTEAVAAFRAQHPEALAWAWQAGPDPTGAAVRGEVMWSGEAQRGLMRFDGLAPNDPSREQYQLWVFDAARDERYPVDGGVFDVTTTGEVVVPIDARVPVERPVLFAVTVEPPGGVVVSSRARIATLAKPAGG